MKKVFKSNFAISFFHEKNAPFSTNVQMWDFGKPNGQEAVDFIKRQIGLEVKNLKSLTVLTARHFYTPKVCIPNSIAIDSGLFDKSGLVKIKFHGDPKGLWDNYKTIVWNKWTKRKEICFEPDAMKIAKDWQKAGYPKDIDIKDGKIAAL